MSLSGGCQLARSKSGLLQLATGCVSVGATVWLNGTVVFGKAGVAGAILLIGLAGIRGTVLHIDHNSQNRCDGEVPL